MLTNKLSIALMIPYEPFSKWPLEALKLTWNRMVSTFATSTIIFHNCSVDACHQSANSICQNSWPIGFKFLTPEKWEIQRLKK